MQINHSATAGCVNYRNSTLNPLNIKKKSSNQLFSNIFGKMLLSRNVCQKRVRMNFRNFNTVQCIVEIPACDLVSHIFGKNFVKVTLLQKKLLRVDLTKYYFGEREFLVKSTLSR